MAGQPIIDGTYIAAGETDDPDTAADFDAFADEMRQSESADAWITVTRIPMDQQGNARANTKHAANLFYEPLGTNTVADVIERIRSGFMSPGEKGMFRVIGTQKGTRGPKFNRILTIERSKEKENVAGGDKLSELMRVMMESQRAADERAERIIQASQSRITTAVDPMDQMVKMMAAMGSMMGPMMAVVAGRPMPGAGESPSKQLLEMATAMKAMQGLFGGGAPPEDDSGVGIIKAIGGIAQPMLTLMAETKRNETERLRLAGPKPKPVTKQIPKPAPAATPNTNEAPPQTEIPQKQNEVDPVEMAKMESDLNKICDLRDAGKTPAEVAKLILSFVPQENDEEFLAMIDSDDYVSNMTLLNPRVGENVEWANALRAALLAEYEPDAS